MVRKIYPGKQMNKISKLVPPAPSLTGLFPLPGPQVAKIPLTGETAFPILMTGESIQRSSFPPACRGLSDRNRTVSFL